MIACRTLLNRTMVATLVATFTACAGAEPPRTVDGECGDVFGAEVCTWGTFAGEELVEFGATIPLATIDGAPADAEMEWPPATLAALRLPAEVRETTGFDHLGMNWEPHGHPPATFMAPHFDLHFYTLSPAEIAAIDCSDLQKPDMLPDGYELPDMDIPELGTLVGACVPTMGMHAVRQVELDETELFGASMIIGYYNQSLMSVEPMISQAKLQERQSFAMDIPTAPDPGAITSWPSGFEAVYDAESQAYRLTFRASEAE
jgi:hypothetical protein